MIECDIHNLYTDDKEDEGNEETLVRLCVTIMHLDIEKYHIKNAKSLKAKSVFTMHR